MKIVILSLLLLSFLSSAGGQTEYVKTGGAVLYGLTSGLSEGYRLEFQYNNDLSQHERNKFNSYWHNYAFLRNATGLLLGIYIGLNETSITGLSIDVLTSAGIFFIVNDATINVVRGFNLFRTSDQTPAFTESFASFPFKLLTFISVVLLKLFRTEIINFIE